MFLEKLKQAPYFFRFNNTLPTMIYFVFCGVAPLVALVGHYDDGFDIALMYAPLFIYPICFGVLTVPIITSIDQYVHTKTRRRKTKILLWIFVFVVSLLALIFEINSENIGPYEVNREVLESNTINIGKGNSKKDVKISDYFHQDHSHYYKSVECLDNIQDDRCAYQKKINELIGHKILPFAPENNWSVVRYFYILSFFIQAVVLVFTLYLTALLIKIGIGFRGDIDAEFRAVCLQFILLLMIATIWLFMRIAFFRAKIEYFPYHSYPVAEVLIGIMYILAMILVCGSLLVKKKEHILSAIGLVFALVSIVLAMNPVLLEIIFAPTAIISTVLLIYFAIFVLGTMYYLTSVEDGDVNQG